MKLHSKILVSGSTTWRIYEFLKKNCVGQENAMTASSIIEEMDLQLNARGFRYHIERIRNNGTITREVGSNSKDGYWLSVSKEENGLAYLKSQIASRMETAVASGVSVEYLYTILNELDNKIIVDQNQRLKLSKYSNTESKRYSNDLLN